eukprot:TRINITY_DN11911_c0_g1_i1.p1 TRINITY_DN11911_c0_g1~~TRINITY_DN11911_c0_g1_i1.p1  ORF type:complete len:429 (-),score=70.42 TRINITY_DN11911_c0_g1_i1:22-1308(-)
MSSELVIGCVGKPSAGKSSYLNAATDANAKVGNYPFTTIEPNYGVTLYPTECPCVKYEKTNVCAPRYGKCVNGTRFIPIKMLDVAGLVPGASEGKGLGNQFLDDLRNADVLLHVVDVSGTTNEKGESTVDYSPVKDIEWLKEEIHSWIFNNLWKKWSNIVRRHIATKSSAAQTLQLQFSGYGTRLVQVQETLDKLGIKEPSMMETWDEFFVKQVVWGFLDVRFPIILVLNKVDLGSSDPNIAKICKLYPTQKMVPTSALTEIFLRKLNAQKFIVYKEGDEVFYTQEDEDLEQSERDKLKALDEKTRARLEKVKDLVMFRYGGTGIQNAIKLAVDSRGLIPVYPVKNLHSMSCDKNGGSVFRDCILVPPNTTVREIAGKLHPELDKYFLYAEGPRGVRRGENEVNTPKKNNIKFTTASETGGESKKSQQ